MVVSGGHGHRESNRLKPAPDRCCDQLQAKSNLNNSSEGKTLMTDVRLPRKTRWLEPEVITPEMAALQKWAANEKQLIADAAAARERAKPQHTGWKPDVWSVPVTPPPAWTTSPPRPASTSWLPIKSSPMTHWWFRSPRGGTAPSRPAALWSR
jgi:hypothetical protein